MNKLINEVQSKNIPALHDTADVPDPLCQIKLFTPDSNWTWYVIELCKEDNTTCYGYVQGFENELGYFSLEELESVTGPLGLAVERDLSFIPTLLSNIRGNDNEKQ